MKKFVVLYYSPPGAMQKMATASKEEMQAGQAEWMKWFDSNGDGIVDQGEYFKSGTRFVGDSEEDATGTVTGYTLIQATDMAAAQDMVRNHPHLAWYEGCSVEVYEPMQMGGN